LRWSHDVHKPKRMAPIGSGSDPFQAQPIG